jgi:archaeal type IV pilus assembly protein PilA
MTAKTYEAGVSPVIGVMLMLVVTIIVAAIVAAFAGGLGNSQSKAPQATISATYSQGHGLIISHDGGESLTTGNLLVEIRESPQLYQDADHWIATIDHANITNLAGNYDTSHTWATIGNISAFLPGDIAYVSATNSSAEVLFPQLASTNQYTLSNSTNIGKTIYLEVYDTKSNKMIAKTSITIQP